MEDFWDRVGGLGGETWKGFEWVELLVFLTRLRGIGTIPLISDNKPENNDKPENNVPEILAP